MHPIAHGIDVVEIQRITEMLEAHPTRFVNRVFTTHESARARGRRRAEHLAVRFAAKEAVMKALGTGLADGITWKDIEVVTLPSGRPTLKLTGRAAAIATRQGIGGWLVSLSHVALVAVASVIAISKPPRRRATPRAKKSTPRAKVQAPRR